MAIAPGTSDRAQLTQIRLTQYAHGGGCACKIPPGELETMRRRARLDAPVAGRVRRRCWSASTTATTRRWWPPPTAGRRSSSPPTSSPRSSTTPTTGAGSRPTNALSDIYAMGGRPVLAVNLLCWPRDVLPMELAGEVLRGGLAVATRRPDVIWSVGTASTTRSPSTAWPSPASSTRTACSATTRARPGNRCR